MDRERVPRVAPRRSNPLSAMAPAILAKRPIGLIHDRLEQRVGLRHDPHDRLAVRNHATRGVNRRLVHDAGRPNGNASQAASGLEKPATSLTRSAWRAAPALSYTRPRCVLTVELEMPRAVAVSARRRHGRWRHWQNDMSGAHERH
jgi:hypothetical protein